MWPSDMAYRTATWYAARLHGMWHDYLVHGIHYGLLLALLFALRQRRTPRLLFTGQWQSNIVLITGIKIYTTATWYVTRHGRYVPRLCEIYHSYMVCRTANDHQLLTKASALPQATSQLNVLASPLFPFLRRGDVDKKFYPDFQYIPAFCPILYFHRSNHERTPT